MTKCGPSESVVSRVLTEDVLTLAEARSELASITGKRPDRATMTRWVHRGVGGIKLEAVRLGVQLLTSRQAITRFIESRTAKTVGVTEARIAQQLGHPASMQGIERGKGVQR